MDDIKKKVEDLLAANPELVEKVKNAPAEAAQFIKDKTGLNLDASDLDKIKAAYNEFTGDDGLDLGDFQRAFAALMEKGKEAAANVDVEALKDQAGELLEKGGQMAGEAFEKGKAMLEDVMDGDAPKE